MSLDSSSFSQIYLREMEKRLESSIEETFTLLMEMMQRSLPALYVSLNGSRYTSNNFRSTKLLQLYEIWAVILPKYPQ